MTKDLYTAFSQFEDTVDKKSREYSGLLGLPVASKTVEVPNRNGYVYVRLRDNTNEIIQAYNEKVSPVYNLPVIVTRQGNRWTIVGRDINRYENWGSDSAFLPAHAPQHEFPRDNPGGDIVFSYADQFMPLNVYPSGTPGSPNVFVGSYNFKKSDGAWAYAGNTGTQSLLIYNPTDNQARMVLVYLDRDTGTPGLLVNSGTSFAANLTGSADILPYLPANTSTQEPLKAVRLVSGTTYVGWDNLYDVRQFYGGGATGTGGGGDATLTANRVVVTNDAGTQTTHPQFQFDYDNNVLIIGAGISNVPGAWSHALHLVGSGSSPTWTLWAYGASVAGFNTFFRARGDWDNPTAIQHGDVIGRPARFRGHDGTAFPATRAEIRGQARGIWDTGSHGTEIVLSTTPSGTTTMQDMVTINQAGSDLLYGNYMISGSPHTHKYFLPFGVYINVGPFSTSPVYPYTVTIDRTITFVKFSINVFVLTTNDGSNYWTIDLYRQDDSSVAAAVNSSGMAPNTNVVQSTVSFNYASVGASNLGLVIRATKTGSPGNLYLFGPLLEVS